MKAALIIQHSLIRAWRYNLMSATDIVFEIFSKENLKEYIVNLDLGTCTCNEWQATGILCGHALAVLIWREENPQTYAKEFPSLEFYHNTYAMSIFHPLRGDGTAFLTLQSAHYHSDSDLSSEDDLQPPSTRRPIGRPMKCSIRTTTENNEVPYHVQWCTHCRQ